MATTDRDILDAAAQLFYERGFDAVSVDEIGARAGITGPAIYRHFKGKEQILSTLFEEALDHFFTGVGPPGPDPRETIAHMTRTHFRMVTGNLEWSSIAVREGRSLSPDSRRRVRRREARYMELWTEAIDRCTGLGAESARTIAYAVVGMLNSVVQWPAGAVKAPDTEEYLVSMALGAMDSLAAAHISATAPG